MYSDERMVFKITKFDRNKILEVLVKYFINQ